MESPCYLCDDLIRDILVRLPTKSLLRFKSLSKPWSSLISDPCFRRNSPKLIISESPSDWFSSDLWSSPGNLQKLDLPVELVRHKKNLHGLELVGSCKGLLLLRKRNRNHLWILNASTRECCSIDVGSPGYDTLHHKYNNYGFGYDSVNDDYKVIRISSYRQYHDKLIHETLFVYSLRNNAWRLARARKGSIDPGSTVLQGPGVLVGGKLHWFALRGGRYKDGCRYILAFDVSDEYFEELVDALPKGGDANSHFEFLTELGGCLGVTELTSNYSIVAVWILNESGWVRVFKTRDGDLKYNIPLTYSKNGDEVMMCNGFSYVWYNKENGKVDEIFSFGSGRAMKITMCLDTLVSISAYRSHEEKEESRKRRET